MLFKQPPDISQVLRHYCRHSPCAQKLKVPVANRRAAFCCKSCAGQFYRRHCVVCEAQFGRKTERRRVCWRSKCRYEFLHHPGSYFSDAYPIADQGNSGEKKAARYPTSLTAHNGSRNPIKPGIKINDKPGRGWHVVAGPPVDPINLRAFPADAVARRTGRPGPVLITRTTPPVNVIGGFRFPGAPKIDLSPSRKTPEASTIGEKES